MGEKNHQGRGELEPAKDFVVLSELEQLATAGRTSWLFSFRQGEFAASVARTSAVCDSKKSSVP